MKVQDLIDQLQQIENKDRDITVLIGNEVKAMRVLEYNKPQPKLLIKAGEQAGKPALVDK